MDPIVVVAIILGIIVVLFLLDRRLNRGRTRPWQKARRPRRRLTTSTARTKAATSGHFSAAARAEAAAALAESPFDQARCDERDARSSIHAFRSVVSVLVSIV